MCPIVVLYPTDYLLFGINTPCFWKEICKIPFCKCYARQHWKDLSYKEENGRKQDRWSARGILEGVVCNIYPFSLAFYSHWFIIVNPLSYSSFGTGVIPPTPQFQEYTFKNWRALSLQPQLYTVSAPPSNHGPIQLLSDLVSVTYLERRSWHQNFFRVSKQ